MSEEMQRPVTDDREAWKAYWKERGMPWRTEPEIDEVRQRQLNECRIVPPEISDDIDASVPLVSLVPDDFAMDTLPRFKSIEPKLNRADVEWLLATQDDGSRPIDWERLYGNPYAWKKGLDLRGSDLRGVDLSGLPLTYLRAGCTEVELVACSPEQQELAAAHLERTILREAHLEGAILGRTYLQHADLSRAHLEAAFLIMAHLRRAVLYEACGEGADFSEARLQKANFMDAEMEKAVFSSAHLERASLWRTQLQGAKLAWAHLEGANIDRANLGGMQMDTNALKRIRKWDAKFPEILPPASLHMAFLDGETSLEEVILSSKEYGCAELADIHWGDANLMLIDWSDVTMLGDERSAWQITWDDGTIKKPDVILREFQAAVRANRQLATALRNQGLNENANPFAYRAYVLQRLILRRQGYWLRYLGSLILDWIAGYGYKPLRSVITYVLVIIGFAIAYFLMRNSVHPALNPLDAVIFSITSFHGRGFNPGESVNLHNPLTVGAAVEAIIGLLIEIVFIATFTQRFFAR